MGDEFAGRWNDASGAPDGGATKGSHPPEAPQRSTPRGRAAGAGVGSDPQLAGDVAGRDAGEHVRLVADPGPCRAAAAVR